MSEYKHKEDAQSALILAKESGEADSLDFNGSYLELERVYAKAAAFDEFYQYIKDYKFDKYESGDSE